MTSLPDLTPDEDTLEPVETWPLARLRALQTERLRWTLRHAYERVPYHKLAFDAARVHPDDFEALGDLARFPFTTSRDLRDTYPFTLVAVPRERIVHIRAASAIGERPAVMAYTQKDTDIRRAVLARSLRAAGVRPGWLVHLADGAPGGNPNCGIEKYGCAVMPVFPGQAGNDVRLIADFMPEVIIASPASLLALRDRLRAAGIDPRQSSFKLGICRARFWTEAARAAIEDAFDMHAVATHGLCGMTGPGGAQECVETKDGLTIWEDHDYPEIIDPRTGRVLRDGEDGELVVTSLTREAMPVIRYRTGEIARLLPGTARTMRRLRGAGLSGEP